MKTLGILTMTIMLGGGSTAEAAPENCIPNSGESFKNSVPSNLRLLPTCENAAPMSKGENHWVFRGRVRLTGRLRATFGDYGTIYFHPNTETLSQLPSAIEFVQLDDHAGNTQLKLPVAISESACFETNGSVKFNELSVLNDDTDSSGHWVTKYKLISLGTWRKCKAQ